MALHPHKGPFQKRLKHVDAVEARQPKYRGNDLIGGPGKFEFRPNRRYAASISTASICDTPQARHSKTY